MTTLTNYLQETDKKFDEEFWDGSRSIRTITEEGRDSFAITDDVKSFLHDCIKEAYRLGKQNKKSKTKYPICSSSTSGKHSFECQRYFVVGDQVICKYCGFVDDKYIPKQLQHLTNK